MSEPAVITENISKVFRIYDKPSDTLKELLSLGRRKYHSDYPALKNISFEIRKGEFLGIVGKNGAGKSTLLKILSGEMTPTSGSLCINGTVALLQLGVGFNTELTGIENARFASKLLGYSSDEVEQMINNIIKFADIGEFIYHPVKTYSSGMYSRLSFAVGININPDILIADEVLAVGDMRFAQKCLRTMREFKEQGKTIILVTHDTETVNAFCDTAMWLDGGEIIKIGKAKSVIVDFSNFMLYNKVPGQVDSASSTKQDIDETNAVSSRNQFDPSHTLDYEDIEWDDASNVPGIGEGGVVITAFALYKKETFEKRVVFVGNEYISIFIKIRVDKDIPNPHSGIMLYDKHGLPALHTNSDLCDGSLASLSKGQEAIIRFDIKLPGLRNGNYIFSFSIEEKQTMLHRIHDVLPIKIDRPGPQGVQCGHVIIDDHKVEIITSKG